MPKDPPSYLASNRLGILGFKVPNKVPVSALDDFTTINQSPKHVTLSTSLHTDAPQQPHNSNQHTPRPAIKDSSQDHQQCIAFLQDHKPQNVAPSQDHHTTANIHNIIALKCTFPTSSDTICSIPRAYIIYLDPPHP